MRGKDPNKASLRRKGHRDAGTQARRDRGRCRRSPPGERVRCLGAKRPGIVGHQGQWAQIARAEPILDVAAEDLSVFVDGRDWAGGADRRWGGLPMTNPKADHRARMSQVLHPVPMSLGRGFLRHSVRFPVKFTDGDRCAALDAGGMTCGDAGGEARA